MMLQTMQPDDFDQVFSIMERSFPIDEYRTYEEQKELLREPGYCISVMRTPVDGKIRAFLAAWQFSDFIFIEHFAAEPAVRGQGLGSLMLQEAVRSFRFQICLEVELPETETAKRRIAFYERNGFWLNDYSYFQPPISGGRHKVPLMIMTSEGRIGEKRFEQIREVLYREVYKL